MLGRGRNEVDGRGDVVRDTFSLSPPGMSPGISCTAIRSIERWLRVERAGAVLGRKCDENELVGEIVVVRVGNAAAAFTAVSGVPKRSASWLVVARLGPLSLLDDGPPSCPYTRLSKSLRPRIAGPVRAPPKRPPRASGDRGDTGGAPSPSPDVEPFVEMS